MKIYDALKIIAVAIVEGVTEWLPVSSTGHIILFERFFPLSDGFSKDFKSLFDYLVQAGAIIAVLVYFRKTLFGGFKRDNRNKPASSVSLWLKVATASIPAISAVFIDRLFDGLRPAAQTALISAALIFYGLVFVIIEKLKICKTPSRFCVRDLTYADALKIGAYQVLAAIPGTSRSGITIIGGMVSGCSRAAATEFSFYMAIPAIAGASVYKTIGFALSGASITPTEISALLLGCVVAFVTSLLTMRFLTEFVKKRSFVSFGIYRILLGSIILILLFSGLI